MATKAILVDAQALERKYGAGAQDIWTAVEDLMAADSNRDIEAQLVKRADAPMSQQIAVVAVEEQGRLVSVKTGVTR